jgi:hypothetical protein
MVFVYLQLLLFAGIDNSIEPPTKLTKTIQVLIAFMIEWTTVCKNVAKGLKGILLKWASGYGRWVDVFRMNDEPLLPCCIYSIGTIVAFPSPYPQTPNRSCHLVPFCWWTGKNAEVPWMMERRTVRVCKIHSDPLKSRLSASLYFRAWNVFVKKSTQTHFLSVLFGNV